MSETFWVILVVAVAVVVVLILYRSRLSSFRLQAGSLETQLETRVVKESGAEQGRGPGLPFRAIDSLVSVNQSMLTGMVERE